ncbi:hypothetical protein [Spirillospora sp. CA-128828]|uniref:hypothetical protein n=1 Tax=Spirillospora sp. CA-128828 TaxID=3240033 RepID=UPI003D923656
MSQTRRTRRGTRTRTRRRRYTLLDHLMLAGISGGGVYVILHLLVMPVPVAVLAAVLAAGFYLGAAVRVPRFRSPIVWRRGR